MEDWARRLDLFLIADGRAVLQDTGKITAETAQAKAETEFGRRLNDNEMFKLWK
ncbi:MAG: virulence RhuM family protein [Mogibacterium sp.]|nr:virulence RhuM family protein [Mogibacterium sp.]